MTAIWLEDPEHWRLLTPAGFPHEQALQDIVAQTPGLLPLSGSPQLVVLGSEIYLPAGAFRLVLVLDQAPDDLIRLVGYLEAVTDGLSIDLVTVAAYEVAGRRVVVPQRIDPGRPVLVDAQAIRATSTRQDGSHRSPGAEAFQEQIDRAPEEFQPLLHRFVHWSKQLEADGLAELQSSLSSAGAALNPQLRPDLNGSGWPRSGVRPGVDHHCSCIARSSNVAHHGASLCSSPRSVTLSHRARPSRR